MLISWLFMIFFKVIDWVLRFQPPAQLFFNEQQILVLWRNVVTLLPNHPVIPWEFMYAALAMILPTYFIGITYYVVRRLTVFLFNR